MKLLNARFGFATNSSSTHSLIIKPGLSDDLPERDGFGWENFTLASKTAKNRYLAATLAAELRSWVPKWALGNVLRNWLDMSPEDLPDFDLEDMYVDHDSLWAIPCDRFAQNTYSNDPIWPSREFVADLKDFLLNTPGLTILGGNDNDEAHPLRDGTAFSLPIEEMGCAQGLVARKDKKDGYWTVFNKITGARFRFHFSPKKKVPERAYAPELVDLTITHQCHQGCKYCYADATPDGKHADHENVRLILQALGELGVFEVAFGGGEPTLYPEFFRMLSTVVYNGIVPNFSTRNLNWLLDRESRDAVIEKVGGFAVSCDLYKDVQRVDQIMERFPEISKKVSIQVIYGVVPQWEWYHIMNLCATNNWPVTILGFKPFGRGKGFKQEKYQDGLPYPFAGREHKDPLPRIGIDTALATQLESVLKKADVPSWLYSVKEGTHSMAISAVTMQAAPSSFAPVKQQVSIKGTEKSIGEAFRSWQNG